MESLKIVFSLFQTIVFPVTIISGIATIFFTLIFVAIFQWTTVIYALIAILVYWSLYTGVLQQRAPLLLPYILFEVSLDHFY